ncbi:MAG TPA: hypothetical protein VKU61_01625 [Candidatus Binatia bacterium]|nr:hypothetical protein [Candidatus Binatia bacterium]
MRQSAIVYDHVDLVLPLVEIAPALVALARRDTRGEATSSRRARLTRRRAPGHTSRT